MPTAVKMEVSPETIIRAVKSMKNLPGKCSWKISSQRPPPSTFKAFAKLGETLK